jgi:hypothetical protein
MTLTGSELLLRGRVRWPTFRPVAIAPSRSVSATCCNRFVRWKPAGVWDQIMDALAALHDAAVQMIDTSIVRVRQHGACSAGNNRSGEAHDNQLCAVLLNGNCDHKRCYWRIAAMMLTGSGRLPVTKAHGQTSRPSGIAKRQSASSHIYTGRVTWLRAYESAP